MRLIPSNTNHNMLRVTTTTTTTIDHVVPTSSSSSSSSSSLLLRLLLIPSPTRTTTALLHATNNGDDDDDDDNNNNNHHVNNVIIDSTITATTTTNTQQQQQQQTTKLVIPTINDDNFNILLNNPTNRPVLVDAFAPWCGPCKLLDKVLRKVQAQYSTKGIDFCRWNVNDVTGTEVLRSQFINAGFVLSKLPSLIVYWGSSGVPLAVRPGFANEYQLDDFLEQTLPTILERTFDEYGVKLTTATSTLGNEIPATSVGVAVAGKEEEEETCLEAKEVGREIVIVETECITDSQQHNMNVNGELATTPLLEHERESINLQQQQLDNDCKTPQECYNRLEQTIWKNRTVVPAMDGIGMFLPTRVKTQDIART